MGKKKESRKDYFDQYMVKKTKVQTYYAWLKNAKNIQAMKTWHKIREVLDVAENG